MFYHNPHAWPLIESGLLIAIIGLLIRRQGLKSESSNYFAWVCFAVTVWFAGNTFIYSCRDEHLALFAYRLVTFLGVSHIVTFVYQFSVSWLRYQGWRKKLGPVSQGIGLAFYLFQLFNPSAYEGMKLHSWGYMPQYGLPLKIFLIYFFFFFLLAFHNFILAYFRSKLPKQKAQIRIMLIAFIISFFSSADYLPKISHLEVYPIGFAATFFWIVIVGYGLVRHQVFNLKDLSQVAQDMRLATMGMMSASLSHEVKNPLYVLKSRAEMYLTKPVSADDAADVKKLCESVVRQSDRILEIVQQFSSFAREGMKKQSAPAAISIQQVIDAVRPFIAHELIQSNVYFKVSLPAEMPLVKAHARALEEVLQNLITNSCQAMINKVERREMSIEAEVRSDVVNLLLKDNGCGIPAEQIDKVFEPFNTSKPHGMGLGLFISKQLLEQMGAKIKLHSEPGKGVLFILTLPRAQ